MKKYFAFFHRYIVSGVCGALLNENTVKIRGEKLFCAGHSVFEEGFQVSLLHELKK